MTYAGAGIYDNGQNDDDDDNYYDGHDEDQHDGQDDDSSTDEDEVTSRFFILCNTVNLVWCSQRVLPGVTSGYY